MHCSVSSTTAVKATTRQRMPISSSIQPTTARGTGRRNRCRGPDRFPAAVAQRCYIFPPPCQRNEGPVLGRWISHNVHRADSIGLHKNSGVRNAEPQVRRTRSAHDRHLITEKDIFLRQPDARVRTPFAPFRSSSAASASDMPPLLPEPRQRYFSFFAFFYCRYFAA